MPWRADDEKKRFERTVGISPDTSLIPTSDTPGAAGLRVWGRAAEGDSFGMVNYLVAFRERGLQAMIESLRGATGVRISGRIENGFQIIEQVGEEGTVVLGEVDMDQERVVVRSKNPLSYSVIMKWCADAVGDKKIFSAGASAEGARAQKEVQEMIEQGRMTPALKKIVLDRWAFNKVHAGGEVVWEPWPKWKVAQTLHTQPDIVTDSEDGRVHL